MTAILNPRELRRAPREDVCFRCQVDPDDGPSFIALIVNISPYGCMLRAGREVAVGELLRFSLPIAGRLQARTIWALGGRLGLEFSTAIELDPYMALIEEMKRPGDEMSIY